MKVSAIIIALLITSNCFSQGQDFGFNIRSFCLNNPCIKFVVDQVSENIGGIRNNKDQIADLQDSIASIRDSIASLRDALAPSLNAWNDWPFDVTDFTVLEVDAINMATNSYRIVGKTINWNFTVTLGSTIPGSSIKIKIPANQSSESVVLTTGFYAIDPFGSSPFFGTANCVIDPSVDPNVISIGTDDGSDWTLINGKLVLGFSVTFELQ